MIMKICSHGRVFLLVSGIDDTDYLSINTAFIGTDLGYKDDYLGLEVHLYYDSRTESFIFNGIDSYAL